MVGWVRGLRSYLRDVALAGLWLSPVLPAEAFATADGAGSTVESAAVAETDPPTTAGDGPAPGHPERLSDAGPTPAERRLWADLEELSL